MSALIYKDLVAIKKSLFLLVLMMVFVGVYTAMMGNLMLLPFIFVLVPLILLGMLWGTDLQSKVDQYIVPGPVNRKSIVLSRYIFVWGIAAIGTLFTILLKLFLKDGVLLELPWYLIAAAMPLLITIFALFLIPLMYKFGIEKARLIFVLMYIIVFSLFSIIGGNKELLKGFFDSLILLDLRIIGIAVLGVTILLNAVSFALSTSIYKKKEF